MTKTMIDYTGMKEEVYAIHSLHKHQTPSSLCSHRPTLSE